MINSMKNKFIITLIMFSSLVYSQKKESVIEEAKSKVFFYGFTLDNKVKENYSLSIPTSLLTKKSSSFSVYDLTSNLNANFYMEGSNYVMSNTTQMHQNGFGNIKKDSFNPNGASSVEGAMGMGLFMTVFDLFLK